MRLAPLVRRTTAVAAATALVTGGLAASALTGPAAAQTVNTVSPPAAINDGVREFTITGGPFFPSNQEKVVLRRNPVVAGQGDIQGTVLSNSARCASAPVPVPDDNCGTTLVFTAPLGNIAPGSYDLLETQTTVQSVPPNSMSTVTKTNAIAIGSSGTPSVTSSALFVGTTMPPDGKLELTGTNLAKGSTVQFLLADAMGAPTTTVDPAITFTPGVDAGTVESGYVSATTLRGTYAAASGFTAGKHYFRVTNTNSPAESSVSSVLFYQPRTTTIVPNQLGQGATAASVVFTGQGYHPSSTVFIQAPTGGAAATDVTLAGSAGVNGAGTTVTVPVTVSPTATTGTRTATVRGPDGGFFATPAGLTITASPKPTSVVPNTRGRGFDDVVTVNGTGFATGVAFDFGPGITAVTQSSTATTASVKITIAQDAALGAHAVTATNPDFGTSTLASGLTVTAAPLITAISPPSGPLGATTTVGIDGTGFSTGGVTVAVLGSDVTVTGSATPTATHVDRNFVVAPGAAPGSRSVKITNSSDGGTSTCSACWGINSLGVSISPLQNNAVRRASVSGAGLSMSSVVTLSVPGGPGDQAPFTATNVSYDGTSTLLIDVPLAYKPATKYTVTATTGTPGADLSCSSCLTVIPYADPVVTAASPAIAGQGAVSRVVTLTGTGFAKGQTVSFGAGTTTTSVVFNDPAATPAMPTATTTTVNPTTPVTLTVTFNVDPAAALGARSIVVTNAGYSSSTTTKAGLFSITARPTFAPTSPVSPTSRGAGARAQTITVTGAGFLSGITADFGAGVTTKSVTLTSATELRAVVDIAVEALAGPRDVAIANADGGRSVLVNGFAVTLAPRIDSISPASGVVGTTLPTVTFTGANLVAGEGLRMTFAGATVSGLTVNAGGTTATGQVVLDAAAPLGKRTVTVTNPDAGTSALLAGFTIVPAAPGVVVTATDGAASMVVSTPNGVTGFSIVSSPAAIDQKVARTTANTAITLAGLTNGTAYTFMVAATGLDDLTDATGYGPARTTSAVTPKFATTLTSVRSPITGTAGSPVTYSGSLKRAGGAAISGASVVLSLTPDVGTAVRTVTLTTSSTGGWSFAFIPTYTTTVRASFAGDADDAARTATTYRMGVATRMTISVASSSSAVNPLIVRGGTTPNKAGRTVTLNRVVNGSLQRLAQVAVASNGSYYFSVKLPRGSYALKVTIGSTTGNTAGSSSTVTTQRT